MRSMRSGSEARTESSNVRVVPYMCAESGMTLNVVPASSLPIVSTTGSFGAISRLGIVCSSVTSWAAAGIGSTA